MVEAEYTARERAASVAAGLREYLPKAVDRTAKEKASLGPPQAGLLRSKLTAWQRVAIGSYAVVVAILAQLCSMVYRLLRQRSASRASSSGRRSGGPAPNGGCFCRLVGPGQAGGTGNAGGQVKSAGKRRQRDSSSGEDLGDDCTVNMRSQAGLVVSPVCERRQPLAPRATGKPRDLKGDLASS